MNGNWVEHDLCVPFWFVVAIIVCLIIHHTIACKHRSDRQIISLYYRKRFACASRAHSRTGKGRKGWLDKIQGPSFDVQYQRSHSPYFHRSSHQINRLGTVSWYIPKRMNSEWDLVLWNSNQNIAPAWNEILWILRNCSDWQLTYVSNRTIIVMDCAFLCHCHNSHTQVHSQWVHIEETAECHHDDDISTFLPHFPC